MVFNGMRSCGARRHFLVQCGDAGADAPVLNDLRLNAVAKRGAALDVTLDHEVLCVPANATNA